MELTNHTAFPALLYRFTIDENRLGAAVVARITYTLRDGQAQISPEQVWPVEPGLWKCPYGPMDPDSVFYRGGVDLFVFGKARPEGGRPVGQMELLVEAGTFRHKLAVFGDRVWVKRAGKLTPGKPQPFEEMPLTLEQAFGGCDEWDQLKIIWPDNPAGKGFVRLEADAEGRPLPNLENPEKLIAAWDDRPEPVGVCPCPMNTGPRLRHSIVVDEEKGVIKAIRPTYFNAAFPGMIAPRVEPGEMVAVSGVKKFGGFWFHVPPCPVKFRLTLGETVIERPLVVDQIGMEPDLGRIFVTWRYHFRYRMVPLQRRTSELLEA